jgi:hypothetical protein
MAPAEPETEQAPAKRPKRSHHKAPVKGAHPPARATKRRLTIAEAAAQWEAAKVEVERQRALIDEAAPVLLAHFERTGRMTYRDRIALVISGGALVLDQPKVREFLGARLHEFQKRTARSHSLRLLSEPDEPAGE